jgi:1-acyl-sn-glycerol-3-phosphate acyltransferase
MKTLRQIGRAIWGIYLWFAFLLVACTTTVLVAVVPGLTARRAIARTAARGIFALTGIPLTVTEIGRLPSECCVVVANHASYLDGVVLTAALPARFSFVIKREMTRMPIAHLLLRRLGSEFVERSDRHRGARDARRILRKAHKGDALAFFPEGTFSAAPGLGRFRSGAFAAAARAGLPVVPVVIRGTRSILPAKQWLPSYGAIEVLIAQTVDPAPPDQRNATGRLLAAARSRMLEHLGEPDLMAGE